LNIAMIYIIIETLNGIKNKNYMIDKLN